MAMTVYCNGLTLILNDKNFNIYELFRLKGMTEIKDRIYNATQRLIVMGLNPDKEFYRDYETVNKISISENGMFYKVNLKNEKSNKQMEILVPMAVFDNEMSAEKMHRIIFSWLDYMAKILV